MATISQLLEILIRLSGTESFGQVASGLDQVDARAKNASAGIGDVETALNRTASAGSSFNSTAVSLAASLYSIEQAAQLAKQAVETIWENSVGPAAAYEVMIQRIGSNTGLTTAQTEQMSASILSMAQNTSAPIEGLAQGYFRLTNEGFNAAQSVKILTAAQELAVATGADVQQTTNLIGIVMHDYSISADQAANVTGAFLKAAHLGNATMEEFAEGLRKPMPAAAELGVSFQSLIAAEAELTRSGLTTEQAGTQLYNFLLRMQNPTKAQSDEIKILSQATGVDLVSAWSHAGVASMGFEGVVNLTAKALEGHEEAIQKLTPQMRGLLAAIALLGDGNKEYNDILGQVNDTYKDSNAVHQEFIKGQEALAGRMGVLHNTTQELQLALGNALLPTVKDLVTWAANSEKSLLVWANAHGPLIAAIGDAAGALVQFGRAAAEFAGQFVAAVVGSLAKGAEGLADFVEAMAKGDQAVANFFRGSNLPGATGLMNQWQESARQTNIEAQNIRSGFASLTATTQQLGPPTYLAATGFENLHKTFAASNTELGAGIPTTKELTKAESDLTRAQELETKASVAQIEGHTGVAQALNLAAAAYRAHNDALGKSYEQQAELARATEQVATKAANVAEQETKREETAAKHLAETSAGYQRQASELIVQGKQEEANGYLAAVELEAQGDEQGAKDAIAAGKERQTAHEQAIAGAKAEATAVRQSHTDQAASAQELVASIQTLTLRVPAAWHTALAESQSAVQSVYQQILAIDQQLTQDMAPEDRKRLENQRTELQGELSDAKQIYSQKLKAAQDLSAATIEQEKAAQAQAKATRAADLTDTLQKNQQKVQSEIDAIERSKASEISAIHGRNLMEAQQIATIRDQEVARLKVLGAALVAWQQQEAAAKAVELQIQADTDQAKANIDTDLAKIQIALLGGVVEAQQQAAQNIITIVGAQTNAQISAGQAVAIASNGAASEMLAGTGAAYQGIVTASGSASSAQIQDLLNNINANQAYIQSLGGIGEAWIAWGTRAANNVATIQGMIKKTTDDATNSIGKVTSEADSGIQKLGADAGVAGASIGDAFHAGTAAAQGLGAAVGVDINAMHEMSGIAGTLTTDFQGLASAIGGVSSALGGSSGGGGGGLAGAISTLRSPSGAGSSGGSAGGGGGSSGGGMTPYYEEYPGGPMVQGYSATAYLNEDWLTVPGPLGFPIAGGWSNVRENLNYTRPTTRFAQGGWLPENVIAFGASGRSYTMERGEQIVPPGQQGTPAIHVYLDGTEATQFISARIEQARRRDSALAGA